jgi:hypothetical protein
MDGSTIWGFIVREKTGLLAVLVALATLVKNVYDIAKLGRESRDWQIKREKLHYDTERAALELMRRTGHDPEIINCLTTIQDNVGRLYNALDTAYRPLLNLSRKSPRSDLDKAIGAADDFAHRQEYRPKIERSGRAAATADKRSK